MFSSGDLSASYFCMCCTRIILLFPPVYVRRPTCMLPLASMPQSPRPLHLFNLTHRHRFTSCPLLLKDRCTTRLNLDLHKFFPDTFLVSSSTSSASSPAPSVSDEDSPPASKEKARKENPGRPTAGFTGFTAQLLQDEEPCDRCREGEALRKAVERWMGLDAEFNSHPGSTEKPIIIATEDNADNDDDVDEDEDEDGDEFSEEEIEVTFELDVGTEELEEMERGRARIRKSQPDSLLPPTPPPTMNNSSNESLPLKIQSSSSSPSPQSKEESDPCQKGRESTTSSHSAPGPASSSSSPKLSPRILADEIESLVLSPDSDEPKPGPIPISQSYFQSLHGPNPDPDPSPEPQPHNHLSSQPHDPIILIIDEEAGRFCAVSKAIDDDDDDNDMDFLPKFSGSSGEIEGEGELREMLRRARSEGVVRMMGFEDPDRDRDRGRERERGTRRSR